MYEPERSTDDRPARNHFSRRNVLKASGALMGTAVLAGCNGEETAEELEGLVEEADEPILDPEAVGWKAAYGPSDGDLDGHHGDATNVGQMMVDVGALGHPSAQSTGRHAIWYDNVWHVDIPGDQDREAHWDLPTGEFTSAADDLDDDGYRLVDQAHYHLQDVGSAERAHAGIWVENAAEIAWDWFWDQPLPTEDELRAASGGPDNPLGDAYSLEPERGDYDDEDEDLLPISIECYLLDDGPHYASVWAENVNDVAWAQEFELSATELDEEMKHRREDEYRPLDLAAYHRDGELRFAVIWVENDYRKAFQGPQTEPDDGESYDGRLWKFARELTTEQYERERGEMFDLGFRPATHEAYLRDGAVRHAVVWRQNGVRAQWPGREQATQYITDHIDDYNHPAASVAIIKDGAMVYRRGFGHRDVEEGARADSRTVYRLASVSKAVAGVLGFRLQQVDELSLDDPTTNHVDGLPDHHTHTLGELLSNQACISHYGDLSNVPTGTEHEQYDSATDALQDKFDDEEKAFWKEDLLTDEARDYEDGDHDLLLPDEDEVEDDDEIPDDAHEECHPGHAYRYSTHGFTFLGAAYEGATGLDVPDLIEQYLSEPLDLHSLQVEDRSEENPNRARLYRYEAPPGGDPDDELTGQNVRLEEGVPGPGDDEDDYVDNKSWAMLGGGLEANVGDLARLGWLVHDAEVIDEDSRQEMWDTDVSLDSNYAYGWNATANDGVQEDTGWHGGTQDGADSWLGVYGHRGVVVAMLSNRRNVDDYDDQIREIRWDLVDVAD